MDQVIGVMLVIITIGLLTDKTLFSPIERFPPHPLGNRAAVTTP
jgi:hypothetical protein